MKIAVNTFAYTHTVELLQMVDSLEMARQRTKTPSAVTLYLHNHSYKPEVHWMCQYIAENYHTTCLFDWRQNRGTGRSINDTFLAAFANGDADVVINANDDTRWSKGTLLKLATYALEHPAYGVVLGSPELQLAAGALTRAGWEQVGCFDENFAPCPYYEDIDWLRRAELLGIPRGNYPGGLGVAHLGSATLAHDPEYQKVHHGLFLGNRAYYERKWGGDMGHETYTTPFNDPALGLHISPDQRARPYGDHDRKEQHGE